jgi:hypothetical protein
MTMTSSPSSRNAANAANMPGRQYRSLDEESTFIRPGSNYNFLPISWVRFEEQTVSGSSFLPK